MTLQSAIAQLRAARNGAEMLQVLDMLAQDSVGYTYAESPMIDEVLGINQVTQGHHRFAAATLEAIEF